MKHQARYTSSPFPYDGPIKNPAKAGPIKPEVGMGATEGVGSDRYPYTIIEVCNDRRIIVQADNYELAPDSDSPLNSENQKYNYSPNPNGRCKCLTLRKDARWREQGTQEGNWGIGHRNAYRDPTF